MKNRITDRQRAWIVLCVTYGIPVNDIAVAIGKTNETVRSSIRPLVPEAYKQMDLAHIADYIRLTSGPTQTLSDSNKRKMLDALRSNNINSPVLNHMERDALGAFSIIACTVSRNGSLLPFFHRSSKMIGEFVRQFVDLWDEQRLHDFIAYKKTDRHWESNPKKVLAILSNRDEPGSVVTTPEPVDLDLKTMDSDELRSMLVEIDGQIDRFRTRGNAIVEILSAREEIKKLQQVAGTKP